MSIVTINGINNSAAGTVNALSIELHRQHGVRSVHLTYPTRSWWATRNRRNQYLDALRMIRQLPTGSCDVIAHSWGCMLTARMMELGGSYMFNNVFLFAPAIDKDWIFPLKAFKRLYVIHNEQDRAVLLAQKLFFGWHPWGDMGRYGYAGEDPRVVNVKDETIRKSILDTMHSHYFCQPDVKQWAEFVNSKILESK